MNNYEKYMKDSNRSSSNEMQRNLDKKEKNIMELKDTVMELECTTTKCLWNWKKLNKNSNQLNDNKNQSKQFQDKLKTMKERETLNVRNFSLQGTHVNTFLEERRRIKVDNDMLNSIAVGEKEMAKYRVGNID